MLIVFYKDSELIRYMLSTIYTILYITYLKEALYILTVFYKDSDLIQYMLSTISLVVHNRTQYTLTPAISMRNIAAPNTWPALNAVNFIPLTSTS